MTELDRKLKKLYPKLRLVDPKSFYISCIYVFLNFTLGTYFFYNEPALHQILTGGIITHTVWGSAFLTISAVIAINLTLNNWRMIRAAMIVAFCLKLFWAVILIFIAFKVGLMQILPSFGMWFSLASIQAVVIIYFIPKDIEKLLAEIHRHGVNKGPTY